MFGSCYCFVVADRIGVNKSSIDCNIFCSHNSRAVFCYLEGLDFHAWEQGSR